MSKESCGFRCISLLFFCAVLVVSACAPRKTVRKSGTDDSKTSASARKGDSTESAAPEVESGDELNIRDGSEFTSHPELKTIHFDYDAYGLSDESRATLQRNAEYLKANPDMDILVAGHCDERGTTEYNLALGQRRAKEVREYYLRLGLRAKSMATISYGKENPSCNESNDACWRENRRAETRIRSRTASKAVAPEPDNKHSQ